MSCALLAALRRLPRACLLALALCVPVAQALASAHLASAHGAGSADAVAKAVGDSAAQVAGHVAGQPGSQEHAGLGAHGACGKCLHALAFAGMAPGFAATEPLHLDKVQARRALAPESPPAPKAVSPFMGRAPPRSALI